MSVLAVILGSICGSLLTHAAIGVYYSWRYRTNYAAVVEASGKAWAGSITAALGTHNDRLIDDGLVSDIPRPGYFKPPF
jgi:hypothetical protein